MEFPSSLVYMDLHGMEQHDFIDASVLGEKAGKMAVMLRKPTLSICMKVEPFG